MPKSFLVKKRHKSKIFSSVKEDDVFTTPNELKETNTLNQNDRIDLLKSYPRTNREEYEFENKVNISSTSTPATEHLFDTKSSALSTDAFKHIGNQNIMKISTGLQSSKAKYNCHRCHRSYSSKAALMKHYRIGNQCQTKSFTCKYCEKVYNSLGALKLHIRTHTLPCACMICGKAFSRPWLLQGHIRTHTGEKPYHCSFCDRAFADRSNLRAHQQTHAHLKKYQCEKCPKTFSRMSLLTKHQTKRGKCTG